MPSSKRRRLSCSTGSDVSADGPRVVSLVPSITETLISWGRQPLAVTRFCEAPGIPAVGGTKNPDIERIRELQPDIVLMDEEENRREDAESLEKLGVRVLATCVRSLDDVAPALDRIRSELRLPVLPPQSPGSDEPIAAHAVSVWVPIWRRPWMSINSDTYGSSILAAAGLVNVLAGEGDRYPTVTLEDVSARSPDVVLAPSEPYKFSERHRAELEAVAPVRFVDGQDLFWWGVRSDGALGRFRQLARSLAAR
jgi:ABC-type Fe3+-hydroxamate transport system substrate-binding protein